MILAARNGNSDLIKILLKLNANIHAKNNLGEDALIAVIKKIIELLKDIHAVNYMYTFIKYKDIIKNLIKREADINLKNDDGDTPLILAVKNGSLDLVKILLKLNANIHAKNNLGEDALIVAIKKIGDKNDWYYRKKFSVFKKLLKFASPNLTNIDLFIKEGLSVMEPSYLLEKTLKIIFDNSKFIKPLLYEGNRPNIARILQIQNLNINEDFKNKIIRKIDEIISLSHNSFIFEDKEFLMETLFSYETFIFRNKGLLIDTFLNVVKLYKLKEEDVKEIKELLLNSLTYYYINKSNNKIGYEEKFLKELKIVKSKIDIFVSNLYNRVEDNSIID